MLNIVADKVTWCDRFSISIQKKDWDCDMLPATFVTDMGSEYKSENFEQIAELGVTVVNLPSYRPELKGLVEKFFDLIQESYKKHLKGKGVIEPDYQERGARDYRKDACLTMVDFEKIVLHCIIYYNSQRIVENFPYTEDMVSAGVKPYASCIWNWGKSQMGATLISVDSRELMLTLLPRTMGKFSRYGLKVNKLRYHCDGYTEQYLAGGTVTVAYNPENVTSVWVLEDGKYVEFTIIESRFEGKDLTEVQKLKISQRIIARSAERDNLQAQINLAQHIEAIAGGVSGHTDVRIKNIRSTRKREQTKYHRDYVKKGTKLAKQQQNQNFKAIMQQEYSGIMGGSDSFTIIGVSGIGKSTAISRAIHLITEDRIIETENPYTKIIPCICVQCPFDSSVKGLLLEILRKVDEAIDSSYYQNALRARATMDMLIGSVSQVALNHIGMLVVDEIQNVCSSKNGKSLVGMLTQLINNSGISICMVGTPESAIFFEQAMQFARRSLGLRYDVMGYGDSIKAFCEVLFSYQYVKRRTEITDAITEWLYEHSSGNISVVVSLIHDAQEIAILNGCEILDLEVLNEAYQQRLSLLHRFIQPGQKKQTSKVKRKVSVANITYSDVEANGGFTIAGLVSQAKSESIDIVKLLKGYLPVKDMTMEDVVLKHTMFSYYGRFLPLERRQRAFQALVSMQGNYHNLLPIPTKKGNADRRLRYCPMCADEDRQAYGETYWHRTHQMIGMAACPVHGCYLMDSSVIISGQMPPMLKSAEEVIPISEVVTRANEMERRLAVYMGAVFRADVDMQLDIAAGQFLYSRMANTKYRSIRGEQRNIKLFHADFVEFYKELSGNWFTELWQIQKVLTNDRINFYEICLLAMFLAVPAVELVNMKLPAKSQQQLFDEEVYRLHDEGLRYPEIAERLNASYSVVKAIGERRYGTYHKPPKTPLKSGVKPQDWQQIDNDTLPLVKDAIRQLRGGGIARPKRVTVFAVEKLLRLPSKQIALSLPQCLAEIRKHEESQEQYWAREVVWAANQLRIAGIPLAWRRIRELTNMRPQNFRTCLPYVADFADEEMVAQLNGI